MDNASSVSSVIYRYTIIYCRMYGFTNSDTEHGIYVRLTYK